MDSVFSFVVGLLTAALSLLGFVQQHPELPQVTRDQAQQIAQQAITQATNALSNAQTKTPPQTANTTNNTNTFATPTSGPAPLTVTFIAPLSAGGDYVYFGDGADGCSIPGVTNDGMIGCSVPSGKTFTHTYTKPGVYKATVSRLLPSTILATATITVTGNEASQTSDISVSGMTKYTDSDFGFSFWYPSGWKITSTAVNPYPLSEGTTLKHLLLTGGKAPIHILEFTSPTRTISIGGGACGFCTPIKFYFDADAHTWMKQYPQGIGGAPDMPQAQFEQTKIPQPADVSNNTMGGLHIFHGLSRRFGDSTVPLSARNFVFVYAESQGENNIELPLVNTIVALDPTVATPVSAVQQKQTIQAAASAYGY